MLERSIKSLPHIFDVVHFVDDGPPVTTAPRSSLGVAVSNEVVRQRLFRSRLTESISHDSIRVRREFDVHQRPELIDVVGNDSTGTSTVLSIVPWWPPGPKIQLDRREDRRWI